MELPTKPNQTPTELFNPDDERFEITMLDDENQPHEYAIGPLELATLPAFIAHYVAEHLADKLLWKRGIKTNAHDDHAAILKEIYVRPE